MTFVVLATDQVSKAGLSGFDEDARFQVEHVASSSPEFIDGLSRAAALVVRSVTIVDRNLLESAPVLRVVARAGVGVDNVDVEAATERGIPVFNSPGGNTTAAAELTMALMLSIVRHVAEADRSMHQGKWERSSFKGIELKGRTLGLVGAGKIGGEVAVRSLAFGMNVIAYDPYLSLDRASDLGVTKASLDEVIEQADVLSLHVPLTDETRGLISRAVIDRMKPGVYVINASRGGMIDEDALAAALRDGRLGGAALDVYEREPLPADSPLLTAPNLVLTPHLGASTAEAQVNVAYEVADAIKSYLIDGVLTGAVNEAAIRGPAS